MSAGIAPIEGVYINLDRAHARRDAMEAQLSGARLPYRVTRFAAIDGNGRADCPPALLPGQHGCWLSHAAVLGRPGAEHLHVMEDDVMLSPRLAELPSMLETLQRGLGGDWDVLYLDATLVELPDMYVMFEWAQSARGAGAVKLCAVPRDFTVYGMISYVVNGARRSRVAHLLDSHRGSGKPVDNVLAHGVRTGALKAYIAAPFVTSNLDLALESSIADDADGRQLAWLLFRRLCFGDLSVPVLDDLERLAARLDGATGRAEALLGRLMAYRVARWPAARFPPMGPA
jgi:hypothetical protein